MVRGRKKREVLRLRAALHTPHAPFFFRLRRNPRGAPLRMTAGLWTAPIPFSQFKLLEIYLELGIWNLEFAALYVRLRPSLNSKLSTSASQLASMMLSETPTVPQLSWPSFESISTRVRAPVPCCALMIRTL